MSAIPSPAVARWGQPPGLLVCCATEFWERFSFYGMRALLVFYLMQHFLFTDAQSYLIYGVYTAMVYMTPVLGGIVADRFLGARRAVSLGAVLLVIGHLGMVFEGDPAVRHVEAGVVVVTRDTFALQGLYLSLAFIATGVGFLKCNTTALVGALYQHDDARRDFGFTLFYTVYNVGAAVAPLLCGWLGQTYGWRYGFGLAGLGMLTGLLAFLRGQRHLPERAEPPDAAWLQSRVFPGVTRAAVVYTASLCIVPVIFLIMRNQHIVGGILAVFGAVVAVLILRFAFTNCTSTERDRLLVAATLIVFTIGFWAIYEQLGSSLNVFADRMVDRSLWGWEMPASMLQSLNPLFIIVCAPPLGAAWMALRRRGRDLPVAVKFSMAIALLGLGFLTIVLGVRLTAPGASVGIGWLILGVFLMTAGEMCLTPVGLAMVTRLAPERIVSMMTGAFFLAYSGSGFISGLIAQLTSVRSLDGTLLGRGAALHGYAVVYSRLGIVALAVAAILLVLAPLLTARMHESTPARAQGRAACC